MGESEQYLGMKEQYECLESGLGYLYSVPSKVQQSIGLFKATI